MDSNQLRILTSDYLFASNSFIEINTVLVHSCTLEFLRRFLLYYTEFWKTIPPSEPYRVIIGEVRDKLYQTRERSRHLLAQGTSDIPEEATYTNVEQVLSLNYGNKKSMESKSTLY